MNRKNYQKALRYATSLIRDYNAVYNPFDLVHDAYLKCQDEDFLIRNVKLVWYEKLREKYTSVGDYPQKGISGQKVPKIFVPISPTGSEYGDGAMDIESNDFYKENPKFDRKLDKDILALKVQGYQNQEIETILNKSNPTITASIKRIKDKLMHTNSPFNGSKLKIVKRIKRKDFEKDKDKYMEEFGKDIGDYESNEFYEQLPSKTKPEEGLLIKEKDSD